MSNAPLDPLQALQSAYALPPDSDEQAEKLLELREHLEIYPTYIPVLCPTLLRGVSNAPDSLLKRWTLDLLQYGIARANLPIEKRTELAISSLDVLSGLLSDSSVSTVKIAVQCFCAVYPLLFRHLCTNRAQRAIWDTLSFAKAKILEFVWSPTINVGVKLSALKFMQRVILVQTRGVSDPRLQKPNDPNLSGCPADHPFISVTALEAEGAKLIEGVLTIFYTSTNPDMMAAVVNSWSTFAKLRPMQTSLIIQALASWNPGTIAHCPATMVRSVEKAVRILLVHLSRTPQGAPFVSQINVALSQQQVRMDTAAEYERTRKAAAAAEDGRKRNMPVLPDEATEAKRQKTDHPSASISSVLANFDFSTLPATLVTDLIVANLQLLSERSLEAAVATYRQARGTSSAPGATAGPIASSSRQTSEPAAPVEKSVVKEEPVDPLQMDIGDEEIDYEPDRLSLEIAPKDRLPSYAPDGAEIADMDDLPQFADFKMPPPRDYSPVESERILQTSMARIWETSFDEPPPSDIALHPGQGASPHDMWMLLLVRMITRISLPKPQSEDEDMSEETQKVEEERSLASMEEDTAARQERIRTILFDYIMTNFPARERLAIIWMNEEWYNDRRRQLTDQDRPQNYDIWLQKLVIAYEPLIDAKDRTFSRFLLDIPHVPQEVLVMLRELCCEPDRMQIGFATLREFVSQRLPLRAQAMKILLDLTTHPEKVTRGAAIITVKKWVPDVQPMSEMVRMFALSLLRRLQQKRKPDNTGEAREPSADRDATMEDGEMPQEDIVQTEYLPKELALPADKAHVLQHVELLFVLSVKTPEFLDEIFDSYGQMDVSVQEAIQDLITALIRSLGPSHAKLLTLMRTFPPGAETLALRVLTIFTETGRPTAAIVSLVKGLMSERELDARFLIPIIAEMDKADIMRHLPRIVSMLNGTPEMKQLVKSVFESIVTTPPQTFGSVTSNLPRVRQSELLTPAELMVLLHESEKEIGLKSAIEAIGICFTMTDVFRSEILAVVMQQIVDEPALPVLFLRTVIQAVTTYKSLVGFVSTTLLSRLITKKIWTNPPLWEGFIRCAKVIAPASFGALLQLPKDQLRELVDKQPGLKSGLREYVLKKAGNKARQAGFLDIFGDDRSESPAPQAVEPQALPAPSG